MEIQVNQLEDKIKNLYNKYQKKYSWVEEIANDLGLKFKLALFNIDIDLKVYFHGEEDHPSEWSMGRLDIYSGVDITELVREKLKMLLIEDSDISYIKISKFNIESAHVGIHSERETGNKANIKNFNEYKRSEELLTKYSKHIKDIKKRVDEDDTIVEADFNFPFVWLKIVPKMLSKKEIIKKVNENIR